ncbi:hypothetical protein PybrP1_010233 [[Pythium] brassicae (nom. inval.)]|nr:hypothetical protein PybrP1_010233 [[Pythium] brassicae (nom. inval.)]
MRTLRWFLLLVGALALTAPAAVDAQTSCGSRTRRNWDSLSTQDKTTYRNAIAAAMDSGAYIKFVEMHTEMRSEMEAHQQCMFIYWHRLFLVVFENMLRGQGSQYACVTVPYWDWITAHNRMTNGQCRSLADCSAITSELGGAPGNAQQRQLSINGVGTAGRCVRASPIDHFCESGSARGNSCARCVTRGAWDGAQIPGSASFASVRNQVFTGRNIGQFSPTLEQGVHNNIHAVMDGAMATFASPSDPVFWSHHAMVDALHVIFHKCRVGNTRMTFQQKANHPVAWTACSRRNNGGAFNPADSILMRTGQQGRNPIQGGQDQLIGRYFQNVPNRYADLMDIRDLGASSYSYELSGFLATMYTGCDGQAAAAPGTQPRVPVPVASPAPAAPSRPNGWRWPWWPWGRRLRARSAESTDFTTNIGIGGTDAAGTVRAADLNSAKQSEPVVSSSTSNSAKQSAPATGASTSNSASEISNPDAVDVVLVAKDCDESTKAVQRWYDETLQQLGGQSPDAMTEIEKMSCMFQDECLGGVKDYSDEFKKTWGAGSPRCKLIVDDIKAGKQSICLKDWRDAIGTKFGCPSRDVWNVTASPTPTTAPAPVTNTVSSEGATTVADAKQSN